MESIIFVVVLAGVLVVGAGYIYGGDDSKSRDSDLRFQGLGISIGFTITTVLTIATLITFYFALGKPGFLLGIIIVAGFELLQQKHTAAIGNNPIL